MITSVEFLIALLLGSAIFPLLPGVNLRRGVLSAANMAVLYSQMPDAASWGVLAAFLLFGFGAAAMLRRRPSSLGMGLYLLVILSAFIILKKYGIVAALLPGALRTHTIAVVGLSYMLFRQIHFVVDAMQGQFERLSFWTYLNYQLNLFALLAGPIQRYQDFCASWAELRPNSPSQHDLLKVYLRLFLGVIKVAGIAAALSFAYDKAFERIVAADAAATPMRPLLAVAHFAAVFYVYPLYMYVNFSGYCDIVIAGAALFGIRLPENFDQPYRSRNILDFWSRWHQTLGFWIRDYLFMPIYKAIAERSSQWAPSLAFVCYFIAFTLAGIWHGSTSNFVVFGVLHGLGASAAKLWEMILVKRKGRPYLKQYLQSGRVRAVAVIATLHFVALTMLFFPHDLGRSLIPVRVVWTALRSSFGS